MLNKGYDALSTRLENLLARALTYDDDCVCREYGLWESLSVDMLSPDETRLLAEHLDECEKCRDFCATAFELSIYDDMPFDDRMRALRDNPSSETDDDWKRIALAFDPTLEPAKEFEAIIEARILVDVRRFKAKDLEEAKVKAREKLERFLVDLQNDRDYAPDSIASIEAFD
ncbi:MAG: hypothetical protein IJO06_13415 [Thermoguttaceae bacterium]|nr:hypothetical protein [Thermoguttaceae bacterium]